MKLPNSNEALIPSEKLSDYLLSPTHPIGRFKAAFFRNLGFEQRNWQELEEALRGLLNLDAELVERSQFGQKYIIRGEITGPAGRNARVVSVWIILAPEDTPRFVTAYPED